MSPFLHEGRGQPARAAGFRATVVVEALRHDPPAELDEKSAAFCARVVLSADSAGITALLQKWTKLAPVSA